MEAKCISELGPLVLPFCRSAYQVVARCCKGEGLELLGKAEKEGKGDEVKRKRERKEGRNGDVKEA